MVSGLFESPMSHCGPGMGWRWSWWEDRDVSRCIFIPSCTSPMNEDEHEGCTALYVENR